MPQPKRYISDQDQWVDGIYVDSRMPFWTESEPKPDWEPFDNDDHSAATPVP